MDITSKAEVTPVKHLEPGGIPFVRVNEQGIVLATLIPEDMEKIADLVVRKLEERRNSLSAGGQS